MTRRGVSAERNKSFFRKKIAKVIHENVFESSVFLFSLEWLWRRTRHSVSLQMLQQRKHIRLRNFDYSSPNAYFITVCVRYGEPLLGTIKNGICGLSEIGNETALCLQTIPECFVNTRVDEFIIMPNHLHCILLITHRIQTHAANNFGKPVAGSVSNTINHFKGEVTKWCRRKGHYFQWQPRFHDHVIRNEQEYQVIKNYISNNPKNWQADRFYA